MSKFYAIIMWVMEVDKEKEMPRRKSLRWRGFDYSRSGAYFITICTENRRQILSRIIPDSEIDKKSNIQQSVGIGVLDDPPNVELLPYGIIANKYIKQLNEFYDMIDVDKYVIMPNHIHILLVLKPNESGSSRTPIPTAQNSVVSRLVSTFKRFCNKEYGENIWQSHFHDHIIRNQDDYDEIAKYIRDNPKRWIYDELYVEE